MQAILSPKLHINIHKDHLSDEDDMFIIICHKCYKLNDNDSHETFENSESGKEVGKCS